MQSLSDLNTPSYMKKYLSQSTQVTRSQEREAEESIVRVEDQESHVIILMQLKGKKKNVMVQKIHWRVAVKCGEH